MSYRHTISRDQYHQLEVYQFRLTQFLNSYEYRESLTDLQRRDILIELTRLDVAIPILRQFYMRKDPRSEKVLEKPVVAWSITDEYGEIMRFSCIKVAAKCLGCNSSKISAVCKNKRDSTGNGKDKFAFMYEDEYIERIDQEFVQFKKPDSILNTKLIKSKIND